jgi:hypothetical protein
VDPATGKTLKDKGSGPRSTLTGNGRVSLSRRRWQGPGGGGVVPADALLDAAEATVSLGARELGCRTAADARSFARAAANLKLVGQLTLSTELLRQVAEQEGKGLLRAGESGDLEPGWKAEDCLVKTPGGREVSRVYLGVDGFMAPLLTDAEKQARRRQVVAARRQRGKDKPKLPPLPPRRKGADGRYKEFKLVQFHDESMEHRIVSVTRKPCGEAGRIMRRDARRIGFERAEQRLANVDGGPWIINQIMLWTVTLTGLCLDFFHLGKHLDEGKRMTFGEDSQPGKQWAAELMHAAKHQGYQPLWDRLVQWRSQCKRGRKRKEADGLLNYVCQRKDMIRYDQFMQNGWRISSSTTESQCGAVPHRVKGGGKRWDADNAEAIMALETAIQSNLWQPYWTTCASQMN